MNSEMTSLESAMHLLNCSSEIRFTYMGVKYKLQANNRGLFGEGVNPLWWRLDYEDYSEDTFIEQFRLPEDAFKYVYENQNGLIQPL